MNENHRHAPTMIYDGDCGFCRRSIRRFRALTGDSVRYEPYQEALMRFPQVSEAAAERAVQLVLPDGEVLEGAAAVTRALRDVRGWRWTYFAYVRVPGFGGLAEAAYRWVARNRSLGSRLAG